MYCFYISCTDLITYIYCTFFNVAIAFRMSWNLVLLVWRNFPWEENVKIVETGATYNVLVKTVVHGKAVK